MIGLIHVILFDLIESKFNKEKLNKILSEANISEGTKFRIDKNYDDGQWQELFNVTVKVLDKTPAELCEIYAIHFHEDALIRWPMWYKMAKNSREFLLRQPAIHSQFATSILNDEVAMAINEKLILESKGSSVCVNYQSPNKLCQLYMSLAQVIADHYGDEIEMKETKCMHNNYKNCVIDIDWITLKNE